jgi:DNA-directed RNA polymerase subunit H (RpoH/RPB5)
MDFQTWTTLTEDKSTKAQIRLRLLKPKEKSTRQCGLVTPCKDSQPVSKCDGCIYLVSENKKRSVNKFLMIDEQNLPKPCKCDLSKNSFKAQDGKVFKFEKVSLTLQQLTEIIAANAS